MTIVELQAFIDSKPDIRSIINEMADYLQANPPGGGGSGFPASLAADTTVDLNGKVLSFQEGANEFFNINPVTNAESARLGSFNTTDDNNKAFFEAGTSDAQATFTVYADFNDGVKNANIFALADATTSTLSYSADTHTVNGDMILAGLAGNGVGIVAVDNDGKLSWAAA